jgi:hypothetical protein
MKGEQLYVIFFIVIGAYLILSSLDIGLTSAASKNPSNIINGTDIWTRVLFGMIAGIGVIYLSNVANN